ncbi:retrotransposon protein [Plasmopara halstedii]|uniref:Retrotransposon protein n=1 Tax=Plasmopara halstedii TaxID=4781 RepID=A0A0N7L4C1_PLAHL|nr:retrotransposon protein [Plasmopara halstedii]CEG38259.1 retrotransposon protein [Plasmopara halstedii]|eukprot:XP_024574628.1 retrotransposon protein [Plasmopara halstedii]
MQDLILELTEEFVPSDLQERLRDQLYHKVTDMSELGKITYFTRGIMSPTREEVQYRRCKIKYRPPVFSLDRSRLHTNGNQQQQSASARPQENEPEPIEIDSESTQYRRSSPPTSSSRKKSRYCKKPGHVIEQCFELKSKEKYTRQNRHEQSAANFDSSSPAAATNVSTSNSVTPSSDEEEVVEVEEFSTSTLPTVHRENELIRKQRTCEGKPVVIMFDSGAKCNVVRLGQVNNMSTSGVSQVTRFDETSTRARSVKKCIATIGFGRYRFRKLQVMEWPLESAHDVILGKPWFTKFQPNIDWRSHEFFFPSMRNAPPTPPHSLRKPWKLPLLISNAKSRQRLTAKCIE